MKKALIEMNGLRYFLFSYLTTVFLLLIFSPTLFILFIYRSSIGYDRVAVQDTKKLLPRHKSESIVRQKL